MGHAVLAGNVADAAPVEPASYPACTHREPGRKVPGRILPTRWCPPEMML